ncbi:MAG: hypothetical protein AAGI91_12935, partial [Bacteroidota bacterium]
VAGTCIVGTLLVTAALVQQFRAQRALARQLAAASAAFTAESRRHDRVRAARNAIYDAGYGDVLDGVSFTDMVESTEQWTDADLERIASVSPHATSAV